MRWLSDSVVDHLCQVADWPDLTGTKYEVIEKIEQVSQRKVAIKNCARRSGDPAVLVADASHAARELGWAARHSSLDEIIETAWRWHSRSRTTVRQGDQDSA